MTTIQTGSRPLLLPRPVAHIILTTYEFTFSPFSGNGILTRSLVKSLLCNCDTEVYITVWCCRPNVDSPCPKINDLTKDGNNSATGSDRHKNDNTINKTATTISKDAPLLEPEITSNELSRLQVISVPVNRYKWGRLDDLSSWEEFIWDNLDDESKEILSSSLKKVEENKLTETRNEDSSLNTTAPTAGTTFVCFVDWSGYHAWNSIPRNLIEQQSIFLVNLNFRVYSSGISDTNKRIWYDKMETKALKESNLVIALSEKDKKSLINLSEKNNNQQDISSSPPVHILLPPLRGDIEAIATKKMQYQHVHRSNVDNDSDQSLQATTIYDHLPIQALEAIKNRRQHQHQSALPKRCFISCVVRLSPEKDTLRFVDFIESIRDIWDITYNNTTNQESGKCFHYIPLLVASSGSDPIYAKKVKNELCEVTSNQCVIVDTNFLSPIEMGAIFSMSIINFHPCAYDAYGMTIIEAGAFACPSIIAKGNTVGASTIVGTTTTTTTSNNKINNKSGGDNNGNNHDRNDNDNDNDDIIPACIEIEMYAASSDSYKGSLCKNSIDSFIKIVKTDPEHLIKIGVQAQRRALAWDEKAYGKKLLQYLGICNSNANDS